jgi:peptidoglycan/LPS O-acetylase OafA/YrhL
MREQGEPKMTSGIAAKAEHIATLDILRLVAALSVVFFHVFFRGAAGEPMMGVSYPEVAGVAIYGYLGVNLFFIISGFVIAWSAEGRDWTSFALARFLRLYPGYVVCVTITFAVLSIAASPALPASLTQYLANLTMFAPALGQPFMDGVYWSIVLELVFYGWVTVAMITGAFQRFKLELVTGWLAVIALNEIVLGSGALRMAFITEFGPLFAAGILLHHIRTYGRTSEAMLLLAASFSLSCVTMANTQGWMQAHYGASVPTAHLLVANVFMYGLVIAALRYAGAVKAGSLTLALGGLTYPLYLLHQNVGYVAIDALTPLIGRWAAAALVIIGLVLAAWGIWRIAERPAQRFLRTLLTPLVDKLTVALRMRSASLTPATR